MARLPGHPADIQSAGVRLLILQAKSQKPFHLRLLNLVNLARLFRQTR
jgi:hypothetical protein